MGGAELFVPALRRASGADILRLPVRELDLERVALRIVGLSATITLVGFLYWLLPEYRGDFYQPYWRFLKTIAPFALLIPIALVWLDSRSADIRDELYQFGLVMTGHVHDVERSVIRRHLLGWLVKAFFLPLMVVYLGDEVVALYNAMHGASHDTVPVFQVFYHLSFVIDLLFCVTGYVTTFRLFGSQIQSVEPTVGGWVLALMCYQPFYSLVGRYYLQYDDQLYWDNWLNGWPALRILWGTVIVLLLLVYALSTVAFGLRFSNLTHRGIITSGPYRYSKHPAYLSKNLSWWLISVPFVSFESWQAAVRNCCLLLALNLVYYGRARTEERHLSRDPKYVAYALWMNTHGLLAFLGPLVPALRYRIPATVDVGSNREFASSV